MDRLAMIMVMSFISGYLSGCTVAQEKWPKEPLPDSSAATETSSTIAPGESRARLSSIAVAPADTHPKEQKTVSDEKGTATDTDPEKSEGDSRIEADKLIRQAGYLGLKAERENDVKMGRRSMRMFRQATAVAPDYRKAWEKYSLSLTKLRDRFGHSVVMSNREIKQELTRCKEALATLP